jgi:hypothetical protein
MGVGAAAKTAASCAYRLVYAGMCACVGVHSSTCVDGTVTSALQMTGVALVVLTSIQPVRRPVHRSLCGNQLE